MCFKILLDFVVPSRLKFPETVISLIVSLLCKYGVLLAFKISEASFRRLKSA